MQLKSIIGSVFVFSLLSSAVYAEAIFPPERINCRLSMAHELNCEFVNRDYLQEDHYSGVLRSDSDEIFYFVSGAAYFTPSENEVKVFYTYKNYNSHSVRLRTVSSTIKPDLTSTGWQMLADNVYICNAGYMSCPIMKI